MPAVWAKVVSPERLTAPVIGVYAVRILLGVSVFVVLLLSLLSVQRDTDLPRSLRNLCEEVARDTGRPHPAGDLSAWARQGVLLINAVLTLDHVSDPHLEQSHHGKGWEALTQAILHAVVSRAQPCVILCWGKKAAATLTALDIHTAQIQRLFATQLCARFFLPTMTTRRCSVSCRHPLRT